MERCDSQERASCGAGTQEVSGLVPATQGGAHCQCHATKTGARGRFFVTPHAVERYQERVHRGICYDRALREILEICERAHYVKDYHGGAQYWRGPKPMRLRLLVAPAVGDELPQVITILPAADRMEKR
jgi:hypothetical protein